MVSNLIKIRSLFRSEILIVAVQWLSEFRSETKIWFKSDCMVSEILHKSSWFICTLNIEWPCQEWSHYKLTCHMSSLGLADNQIHLKNGSTSARQPQGQLPWQRRFLFKQNTTCIYRIYIVFTRHEFSFGNYLEITLKSF